SRRSWPSSTASAAACPLLALAARRVAGVPVAAVVVRDAGPAGVGGQAALGGGALRGVVALARAELGALAVLRDQLDAALVPRRGAAVGGLLADGGGADGA